MSKSKKTLYHSELVTAGQCVADIITDVLPSKFKKGTFYVSMMLAGEHRDYLIENAQCQEALHDRKGQRLTFTAYEAREAAYITVEYAAWTPEGQVGNVPPPGGQPAPAAAKGPRPALVGGQRAPAPAREAAPPPQRPAPAPESPPVSQPVSQPAAKAATQPTAANPRQIGANAFLLRCANLEMKCQIVAAKVAQELLDKRGMALHHEQIGGMVGRMFIQCVKENYHHSLPADKLLDITPPAAETAPAPAP